MTPLISLADAKARALEYMAKGYHCGPAVMQVMWQAYGMENEDFLWAGIPFLSGISGQQQAPCGAVSAAAVALGLRHRCSLNDKRADKQAREAIRVSSSRLVKEFAQQFGTITCRELLAIDFSKEGEYKRFRESGIWKEKCERYVQYVIERLYAFEDEPGTRPAPHQP
ncbi:MAG: C_GCAxxG_C_C family protein [Desulfatitalea sp.]|nr:C_GCAxxG_C_C family protein [Desulfatitalea sp.]